jgi:polyphosphate glucokinase
MTNHQGHLKSLGVDIGGSSTKFCLIDEKDRSILKTKTVPHNSQTDIDSICSRILNQISAWEYEGSIGIGFPGIVEEMIIKDAPNLGTGWNGHDFKSYFSTFGIDVTSVLNDADAASNAMIEQTSQWIEKDILCLTIGTGIGSGWISDGKLIEGTEFGREYSEKLQCTLEEWASAKVISIEKISIKEWVIRFSDVLHILIEKYSPKAIMLSGGITTDHGQWFAELEALHSIPMAISDYAEYTGSYGAALSNQV